MMPISDSSFEQLIKILADFISLSVKFKLALRSVLFETTYYPEARILHARETQSMVWFMLDGLAREIRVDGLTFSERTTWFWFPFSFLYTTPGFFSQQSSESTIEVLRDCNMVLMSYENWFRLKGLFKEAEQVTEMIRGANDQLRLQHEHQVMYMTTEERYLENQVLMDMLFRQTKRKFIAEFMGMSIDRLGKLRKKYLR